MVPYVRKSFKKHLKDAFKYIQEPDADIEARLESEDEMRFGDEYLKDTYPAAYRYAYDQTEKEVYQAVEGMYHNLSKFGRPTSNVGNIAA